MAALKLICHASAVAIQAQSKTAHSLANLIWKQVQITKRSAESPTQALLVIPQT